MDSRKSCARAMPWPCLLIAWEAAGCVTIRTWEGRNCDTRLPRTGWGGCPRQPLSRQCSWQGLGLQPTQLPKSGHIDTPTPVRRSGRSPHASSSDRPQIMLLQSATARGLAPAAGLRLPRLRARQQRPMALAGSCGGGGCGGGRSWVTARPTRALTRRAASSAGASSPEEGLPRPDSPEAVEPPRVFSWLTFQVESQGVRAVHGGLGGAGGKYLFFGALVLACCRRSRGSMHPSRGGRRSALGRRLRAFAPLCVAAGSQNACALMLGAKIRCALPPCRTSITGSMSRTGERPAQPACNSLALAGRSSATPTAATKKISLQKKGCCGSPAGGAGGGASPSRGRLGPCQWFGRSSEGHRLIGAAAAGRCCWSRWCQALTS